VHVLEEPEVLSFLRPHMPPIPDQPAVVSPALRGGLRGLAKLLGAGRARTEILSGDPAEVLALAAAQVGADLICVGTGPHRRGSARFGATTPHRLLARAAVPVLVAPRVQLGVPGRILVPFDHRATGTTALQTAARLAAAYEAKLDALYVIETDLPRPGRKGEGRMTDIPFADVARRWATAQVDDLGLPSHRRASFVHSGDAGQQIVAHACRCGTDLIVMGPGGNASAVPGCTEARHVGSTTRFVIWAAPCPVLALPRGSMAAAERPRPAHGFEPSLNQREGAVVAGRYLPADVQ
ncbi:MAG: universal stress protein, partial [Gemmatimonadaceae bacterium]